MLEKEREIGKFDEVANSYGALHDKSVALSGEGAGYFAEHKVGCLKRLGIGGEARVLDYGCGVGNLTTLLEREFASVAGFDPSRESLAIARAKCPKTTFFESADAVPNESFDVVVLSGVLHHVPPPERASVLARVRSSLRADGRVVVFEHNPANPLTRRAVDACPFDDDAILLPAGEIRARLREAGYGKPRQDFVVFFPRALAWLRPLEPWLAWCPIGAQTMTWAPMAPPH